MTTHDLEKVIAAAKEAGFSIGYLGFMFAGSSPETVERLYAIAYKAGSASRDAEVAELREQLTSRDAEIENLKTVPMRYRRLAFNAKLQDENDQLRKHVTLLRGTINVVEAIAEENDLSSIVFRCAAALAATEPKS